MFSRSPSCSLCTFFDTISSTRDKVLSIYVSPNACVFGDFNVYHKRWLTYSHGTDLAGKLFYSFPNFPTQIPNYNFNSSALFDLFISSDPSFFPFSCK